MLHKIDCKHPECMAPQWTNWTYAEASEIAKEISIVLGTSAQVMRYDDGSNTAYIKFEAEAVITGYTVSFERYHKKQSEIIARGRTVVATRAEAEAMLRSYEKDVDTSATLSENYHYPDLERWKLHLSLSFDSSNFHNNELPF